MTRFRRMHVCPHCNARALADSAVRWSSRELPATCSNCGKLSHVAASSSSGIGILSFVFALVSLGSALISPWLTLAGACLTVAYNVWAWRQVELFPISIESSRQSSAASWWVHVLSILAAMMS
jgi:hypothetical protein